MKQIKVLILAMGLHFTADATMIDWYCPPHSGNRTAEGQQLGPGFVFELGVFKTGFTPTVENRNQWAANWLPAQRAMYHAENQWFTSRHVVQDNLGGFTAGKPAWIWGFAGGPESGEWILMRNPRWRWPMADEINPLALSWRAGNATVFLVGGALGTGAFQTAQVEGEVPPTTTWTQWRQQELGDLAAQTGVDVNGNGIADVLEYILGVNDAERLLEQRMMIRQVKEGDVTYTELVVPRRKDRPAVFDIEMSPDLKQWYPANTVVSLVENHPAYLVYRDLSGAASLGGPGFWRYKLSVQDGP